MLLFGRRLGQDDGCRDAQGTTPQQLKDVPEYRSWNLVSLNRAREINRVCREGRQHRRPKGDSIGPSRRLFSERAHFWSSRADEETRGCASRKAGYRV